MTKLIDDLVHDMPPLTERDTRAEGTLSQKRRARTAAVVLTHENPDGDVALGATPGLRTGKDVVMYLSGDAPAGRIRFPPLEELRRDAGRCRVACPARGRLCERERVGPAPEILERAQLGVNVDHHHDNSRFGDVNLIAADASSAAELVRDVLGELEVALTPEIAQALYVGLVTDTGRFQNTTPSAPVAAELMDAGADVQASSGRSTRRQFAKLKQPRAPSTTRSCSRAGDSSSRTSCARTSPTPARRSRTRRDHRLPPQVEGSEMVASSASPRDDGLAHHFLRPSHDEVDVRRSHGRQAAAIARPQGFEREDGSSSSTSSTANSWRRQARGRSGCRLGRVGRSGSPSRTSRRPSSFALVAELRRRTGARTGHAGTRDPLATGLVLCRAATCGSPRASSARQALRPTST
jgi:phosphoesterase RecJ-like protein